LGIGGRKRKPMDCGPSSVIFNENGESRNINSNKQIHPAQLVGLKAEIHKTATKAQSVASACMMATIMEVIASI
jgi:hypothetical protein